jgi:hypothetical protein
MKTDSLATISLTVVWASICAALMIYFADHSLLIAVLNMAVICLCLGIGWLKGLRRDSHVIVRLNGLYRGAMNGAMLGIIASILAGVAAGRYVPISIGLGLGTFAGMLLAAFFPEVMSRIPSL